jgi:hypothetical protein
MGAWGVRAFENDAAVDWTYELDDVDDLSAVERALAEVEEAGADYLELDAGANALAACEVLARLRGARGYTDPYTETADAWVASHSLTPSPDVVARGAAAIDRVLGPDCELAELWAEADDTEWRRAVEELRSRLLA